MTAALPGAPVIITPAMREAFDACRDERGARFAIDRATVNAWFAEACERTFGPLDAWLAGERVPWGPPAPLEPEHGRTA